jgi:diketogulonate reductase-like aldo/keto reductase
MFIKSADELFGPITTIRTKGRIVKQIAWSAFELSEEDWKRVEEAWDILRVGTQS